MTPQRIQLRREGEPPYDPTKPERRVIGFTCSACGLRRNFHYRFGSFDWCRTAANWSATQLGWRATERGNLCPTCALAKPTPPIERSSLMPKTVKISCDECGADLSYSGNSVDYRVALLNESIPSRGGFVTDMMIYPALEQNAYFCGLGCLDKWRDRERLYDRLRRERSDKWADEHGTRYPGGGRSYPCPPQETINTWDAECQAEAEAAFPRRGSE
jgi:hypothetical protein